MQSLKILSDDKNQFRVRRHHLANKYVLHKEILGHTLGVMQTGFEILRHPNDPTFEDRSIEWTLSVE